MESDAQLARRGRMAVRLVIYPTLLLFLVFAWHHRGPAADPTAGVKWTGSTSQGQRVVALINRDGALLSLDTYVVEHCGDGSTVNEHWYPDKKQFVQHGARVQGRQRDSGKTTDGSPEAFEGIIDAQITDHPHGAISTSNTVTTTRASLWCQSGPVTFRLSRA
jgi:hypothetical protein